MKDITYFVQNELYPAVYNHIDQIFYGMGFQKIRGDWYSPKNIDGTEPKSPRKDKTKITQRVPNRAIENGGGGSKDLISLYMDLYNCDFIESVKAMAGVIGLELPESSPEERTRWENHKKKMDALEESLERQKAALYSPEGKVALEYMHSRGWSDECIQSAELGYISRAEAETIGAQNGVGSDFILSVPLRSSGHLYGYKFRYVTEEAKKKYGKQKYRQILGSKRELFGLSGLQQNNGEVTLVEGELDALHAEVLGFPNMVATGGGGLTDELAEAAKQRGISFINLLLDKDGAGEEFIRRSIQTSHRVGLTVFVATLPDAKDVDEFLKTHKVDELRGLIGEATEASYYLYLKELTHYVEDVQGEGKQATEKDFYKFRNTVIDLVLETPDQAERDRILADFAERTGGAISKEALEERAVQRQTEADKARQKELTDEAIRRADRLQREGNVSEAIKVMGEASQSLSSIDKKAKYEHLLKAPTTQEIRERISSKPDSLDTGYEFKSYGTGKAELFTLPSGAITFVCAPTSHGKSTMLQNLALQIAQNGKEGDTLYFTFEEDGDSVLLQMINKYIGVELCENYNSNKSNNMRAISHYWRTNEDKYIKTDKRAQYHTKENEFLTRYIETGALKIFYEDYDSTELIEAIEAYSRERKVKAVFIDYVQLISMNGCKKARNEELKDICKDLKDLAIKSQLPIVVAAQLNRQTTSPLEMHSQNIAEAADLERIANKVLCIWNSSFVAQKSGDQKKELENFSERTGITLGTGGKMYCKLTKNRGGVVGIEATLDFNGNTGVITPNHQKEEQQTSTNPLFDSIQPF